MNPGLPEITRVFGVDFSGAKLAGRNIWIARAEPARDARLKLVELHNLERLAGTAGRGPALAFLVEQVRASRAALWGMDFPFALPIEVVKAGCGWAGQMDLLKQWQGGAYSLGLHCVDQARALGGPIHIRRTTDTQTKTPFDCYHYRIIYQTFHGMRDVLGPLARTQGTAILPFQYARLSRANRVICESCPGSTLKRLGLPHQNYKQPAGGPLSAKRRLTRRKIIDAINTHIELSTADRLRLMRNPGGDALDAVIAAVGVWQAWATADHQAVRRHARYPREGFLYV